MGNVGAPFSGAEVMCWKSFYSRKLEEATFEIYERLKNHHEAEPTSSPFVHSSVIKDEGLEKLD